MPTRVGFLRRSSNGNAGWPRPHVVENLEGHGGAEAAHVIGLTPGPSPCQKVVAGVAPDAAR
jgi:hypothetical protein